MKTAHRIALIYGVSLLGAAGISYFRQRRGKELLVDTLIHGLVAGTALNVVGFLVLNTGERIPVFASENSYGSLTEAADELELPDGVEVVDVRSVDEVVEDEEEPEEATPNFSWFGKKAQANGMGKTPQKAVEMLSKLNTSKLYADMKESGVKIAEVPENASMVLQDED
jgi:hypothetical protein